jgi:hypothetical protein
MFPARKPSRCASTGDPPWNVCSSCLLPADADGHMPRVTVSATRPARLSYRDSCVSRAKSRRPARVLAAKCRSNLFAISVGISKPRDFTNRVSQLLGYRRVTTARRLRAGVLFAARSMFKRYLLLKHLTHQLRCACCYINRLRYLHGIV